jgi:hypothetical protein
VKNAPANAAKRDPRAVTFIILPSIPLLPARPIRSVSDEGLCLLAQLRRAQGRTWICKLR